MLLNIQESLVSLFELNPDPCYLLDRQGYFIGFNRSASDATDYTPEEAAELHFAKLLAPEHIEQTMRYFERIVTEGTKGDFEVAIHNKNGERVELAITAMPVKINDQVAGVIGIAKDMTK